MPAATPAGMPAAPRPRWDAIGLALALLALSAASFATVRIDWGTLFSAEAAAAAAEFLGGFAPPETSLPFLKKTALAALETVSMSALGTALAALLGLLLALPAAGRFGPAARAATRLLLNLARSVPELVWASILLIAAGLGPLAGTLALAAHTTGVLGRLFAEALENAQAQPEHTLRLNGAGPTAAFLYAALPQSLPQMVSYTLYRWENNIRAAAMLGVVGAGGLGQMLKYHLSLFQTQQAATVILAMLLLVALVDALSFWLRRVGAN